MVYESSWEKDTTNVNDEYDKMLKIRDLKIGGDTSTEEIPDNILYFSIFNSEFIFKNKYDVKVSVENKMVEFVKKHMILGRVNYYKRGDFVTKEYKSGNKTITIDFSKSGLRRRTFKDLIHEYLIPNCLLEI